MGIGSHAAAALWRQRRNWQSNKFINPDKDGAVLPILHLNGYKIANPTILARTPDEMLRQFFAGMGWKPYFVEGSEPRYMHQAMAEALELAYSDIKAIQDAVPEDQFPLLHHRPRRPQSSRDCQILRQKHGPTNSPVLHPHESSRAPPVPHDWKTGSYPIGPMVARV